MMTRVLRFFIALAAPIALAGAGHADTEAYAYDPSMEEGPPMLILYSGVEYTGEAREIYDPIYALPDLQFNDRARSIAVLSGQWEVCQHSDFTGRCVFLRYDVPDLAWFGLSGEVSSVRPVYEYTDAEHGLMFVRDENGYIRYVDNERYGYDTYSYGYGASTAIQVYHYGYSPEYRRYGYYDPRLGYDPYGFGWNAYSTPYYSSSYYHRERPPLRGHYGARDAAVTLYVDSYDRGASLGLNRGITDLSRYRFNDNISSIQIRSGRWEVCEHANYQGRCQIIDASVDQLNGLRLNDNISSIRPVGGTGNERWDRHDRDGGRTGDTSRTGRTSPPPAGSLPPALRNAQTGVSATGTRPVTSRTITSQPTRRPDERVVETGLSGGPSGRTGGDIRRSTITPAGQPDRSRIATPRTLTPTGRSTGGATPARDTRPADTGRSGSPVSRPVPTPRSVAPATPPARPKVTPTPSTPVSRPAPAPVSRPAPAPAPRVSAPVSRPAPQPPRAAPPPQRDTRPPALRSKERPTRTQD
ncbi:MAG: beta/gamma crystallin-related protein [Hyphomonas sp.]